MGGIATAGINTIEACQKAGDEWKKQFSTLKLNSYESNLSGANYKSMKTKMINAICVSKG
jgi:hypothetical protein